MSSTSSTPPTATSRPPFEFQGDWTSPLVATAVHTGNDLRDGLGDLMSLDDRDRFREEDPFTADIAARLPALAVVNRSRFEVDLNRPRDKAVYRTPADCWDLEVWHGGALADDRVAESLDEYDAFYAELAARLDPLAERGPFVLYDAHSYNHRRDGADAPAQSQEENPDVNVGTGSLDRDRFGGVVDAFIASMSAQRIGGETPDVRENVRFKGANVAAWVHERYPGVGCVLALEFKKTFMDEWTGEPDRDRIDELATALAATVDPVVAALRELDAGANA